MSELHGPRRAKSSIGQQDPVHKLDKITAQGVGLPQPNRWVYACHAQRVTYHIYCTSPLPIAQNIRSVYVIRSKLNRQVKSISFTASSNTFRYRGNISLRHLKQIDDSAKFISRKLLFNKLICLLSLSHLKYEDECFPRARKASYRQVNKNGMNTLQSPGGCSN